MTEPTRKPKLIDGRGTSSAVSGNLAMIAEAAQSFRRVHGDESYDVKGVRTIWHQGKLRTEMLSWENKKGLILHQELSFCGLVVGFHEGRTVTTGRVKLEDSNTDTGSPKTNVVLPDAKAARSTLEYASHLLKNVPDRDYYGQHLLKQVNDALNAEFEDETHTVVSILTSYPKQNEETAAATKIGDSARLGATRGRDSQTPRTHSRLIAFGLLILAGLVLGVGIGLLVW